jgi:hypothetical protein
MTKRPLLLILAGLLAGVSAFGQEPAHRRLTTNLLEHVSTILDKASNAQDVDTLLAHLASNVAIRVTFPKNPEIPGMTFTKESYADHLREGWTKVDNMTIRRLKTQYEIGADGRTATAISTFEQTARLKDTGRVIVSVGEERCAINLIDGVPKATSIDVTMEFK